MSIGIINMKAISLWQPWATAMALGIKRNETRSWPTAVRGDIVICSAKRRARHEDLLIHPAFLSSDLLYGCALCIVELYDCVPSAAFHGATPISISQMEADLGDYPLIGRWVWLTRNVRRLPGTIPIVGRQGFFNVEISPP
jgi:hypothetical protein